MLKIHGTGQGDIELAVGCHPAFEVDEALGDGLALALVHRDRPREDQRELHDRADGFTADHRRGHRRSAHFPRVAINLHLFARVVEPDGDRLPRGRRDLTETSVDISTQRIVDDRHHPGPDRIPELVIGAEVDRCGVTGSGGHRGEQRTGQPLEHAGVDVGDGFSSRGQRDPVRWRHESRLDAGIENLERSRPDRSFAHLVEHIDKCRVRLSPHHCQRNLGELQVAVDMGGEEVRGGPDLGKGLALGILHDWWKL